MIKSNKSLLSQNSQHKPQIMSNRWVKLTKFVLCLCTIILHHANSHQLVPSSTDGQDDPIIQASGNIQQAPTQKILAPHKIGLAPHDRPACQLLPISSQRRHQTQSTAEQANDRMPPIVNISQEAPPNTSAREIGQDSSASLAISVPSVISLQPIISHNNKPSVRKLDSSERLRQLRQLLASNNYDAYLVSPNDEHGSEYVTNYDRRLKFISGFSGSNGYALILLDRAVLFTDGRYAIQADQDLDCNWWLVVSDEPLVDLHLWLKANAAKGIKIATDARLMSLQSYDYLDEQIRKLDSEFALISQDLIDIVWNNAGDLLDRLTPPEPIFIHPLQFAGNVSWQEKLIRLADSMNKLRARHYIVSQLDDIAWLLNLRGNDIPMAPLFKAYLFISRSTSNNELPTTGQQVNRAQQQATTVEQLLQHQQLPLQAPQVLQVQPNQSIKVTMYVDMKKINQQVRDHLHVDNGTVIVNRFHDNEFTTTISQSIKILIELKDYEVFIMDIRDKLAPAAGHRQIQGKLLLNAGANVAIHVLAKSYDDRLVLMESLINKLKSVKSDGEVHGMRLAHWRDSLAISMLLAQLELDIGKKGLTNKWTEISAANELEFYRSLMDHNKGQSFDTISAYGSNAAIVHYKPSEEERRFIGNQSTYLLDSGGQYLDGTTDITRTTHYGEPTEFQRETYSRVLMGAIDMMSLIFDQSIRTPYRINDLLARRHLFELGLDYMHGTGHGIGLYSLVHEAPALIEQYTAGANQRQVNANKQASVGQQQQQPPVHSEPIVMQANMFTSVEPGYYRANDFGIRLENIVVTQRVNLPWGLSRPNDRQESKQQQHQHHSANRQFLRFEPISLVPFEPKLIKLELLSNKQKSWLNSYNLMVRLRMTQQINYYLSKIRNQQTTSQPVQLQGAASTSRLYQHLLLATNKDNNAVSDNNRSEIHQIQLGYYNFLRLNGGQFQEKLEQTHKWVMSKTELIPLDVPQSLIATTGKINDAGYSRPEFQGKGDGELPTTAASGANGLEGQRLLLAYMSSLPFNDLDAGEAVAAMSQSSMSRLSVRSGNVSASAVDGASPAAAGPESLANDHSNKCSGFECDLWLVSALNPQQQNRQERHKMVPTWSETATSDSDQAQFGPVSGSALMELFQLSGANQSITMNMWSLVLLGILVVLQLGVMTYMCKSRFFKTTDLSSSAVASEPVHQSTDR